MFTKCYCTRSGKVALPVKFSKDTAAQNCDTKTLPPDLLEYIVGSCSRCIEVRLWAHSALNLLIRL